MDLCYGLLLLDTTGPCLVKRISCMSGWKQKRGSCIIFGFSKL